MADPLFDTTWNMQRGPSIFSAGAAAPDSETRKYEKVVKKRKKGEKKVSNLLLAF